MLWHGSSDRYSGEKRESEDGLASPDSGHTLLPQRTPRTPQRPSQASASGLLATAAAAAVSVVAVITAGKKKSETHAAMAARKKRDDADEEMDVELDAAEDCLEPPAGPHHGNTPWTP